MEAKTRQEVISLAKDELENILNIYFLYSQNTIGINYDAQIETRNLTKNERVMGPIDSIIQGEQFNISIFGELKNTCLKQVNKNNQFLRIALDYCRRGNLENYFENKIIDYFIVLEALFAYGNKMEMTYRISNRIATLLGKDIEDRQMILDKAKFFYDQRSKIVHGSNNKLTKEDEIMIYRRIRKSILRFIVLLTKYDDQKKLLRNLIFSLLTIK